MDYVPFEKPLVELEQRIEEIKLASSIQSTDLIAEIQNLELQALKLRGQIFANLTSYEKVQMARHPKRPNTLDYIQNITSQFIELHGDRNFLDDRSMIAGLGIVGDQRLAIIGHLKGRGTKENIERNFGMPRPEGYRKALRVMSLAERFSLPIVTFIDTPGAYPGIDAEERGQAESIGKNIMVMTRLKVPIICIVIGEGGSGGALAIGVANRIHMLEHSVYSVISPEGCASILLKDSTQAPFMAEKLKVTAQFALELGVIDSILEEPLGGAHRNVPLMSQDIKTKILADLADYKKTSIDEIKKQRIDKFFAMGKMFQVS